MTASPSVTRYYESVLDILVSYIWKDRFEFRRLFEAGALSFAQPSVTKMGGVTEMRKVFALGESFGVPVVPHSPYFGPGLLASMHVVDAEGRWVAGGEAMLRIAGLVPALRPLALIGRLPLLRSLVQPAYDLVAANRHRLSRLLGDVTCPYPGDPP